MSFCVGGSDGDRWWEQWLTWFRTLPWSDVRSLFELLLCFLAIVALLGCLFRLGMIRRIISDFREARGPIWDLRNTVNQLNELEPIMRSLAEQVALMDERVEAWGKQVAELQVEAASLRTDATDNAPGPGIDGPGIALVEVRPAGDLHEEANWLALRDFWRRNTLRLEYVIDQISDGRKKIAFDRLPRTNYERIINRLQGQRLISAAAANASRALNELFYSYRPRNRAVPDEVIGSLRVLDHPLDRELVPFSTVLAADEDEPPGRNVSPARRVVPSPMDAMLIPQRAAMDQTYLGNQARNVLWGEEHFR